MVGLLKQHNAKEFAKKIKLISQRYRFKKSVWCKWSKNDFTNLQHSKSVRRKEPDLSSYIWKKWRMLSGQSIKSIACCCQYEQRRCGNTSYEFVPEY